MMEIDMRCLAVLIASGDTYARVTVGDDDVVVYIQLTATGVDLNTEIGAVGDEAVADDDVSCDPTHGANTRVLYLRRDSIDHTSGLEGFGRTAVAIIGGVIRHIERLETLVKHDTLSVLHKIVRGG